MRIAAVASVAVLFVAGCDTIPPFVGPPPVATPAAPEDLYVHTNEPAVVGRKQFERGNYGLSQRYFQQAVEIDPQDLDSWIGLGASYDNLKRFDLADRAYAQALRLGGRQALILNNLGYSYMLRGDFAKARTIFDEALRLDPTNEVVLNNMRLLHGAEKPFRGPRL